MDMDTDLERPFRGVFCVFDPHAYHSQVRDTLKNRLGSCQVPDYDSPDFERHVAVLREVFAAHRGAEYRGGVRRMLLAYQKWLTNNPE